MTTTTPNILLVNVTMATTLTDVTTNMTSSWQDLNYGSTVALTPPDSCVVFNFSLFSPWAHPEDLVSRETQQVVNRVVNVYLLTLLFFISAPTNIVNMIVYWKQGLKERINLCMFCLSVADFVTVSAHFEWNLDGLYSELTGKPYKLVVMKFNVNHMIHSLAAFIYISGFMSLLIAFERFLCVVYPLKAQAFLQTRTTLIVIVVAHALIFAGHYIIATKWRVVCMFDTLIGRSVDAFYSGEFYLENKHLVNAFESIVFGILLPGTCVIGVLICTVIIVIKLRKMAEWRSQSTSSNNASSNVKDVALTRMLIGVSVLYVVCTTPPLVFHTMLPAEPQLSLSGKYYNTFYLLINMQQLLTYINASVNFFIYYFFGTKFRRGVRRLFGLVRSGKGRSCSKENTATRSSSINIFSVSSSEQSFSNLTDAGASLSAER